MIQKLILKILMFLIGLSTVGRGQEIDVSSVIPDSYNPQMRPGNPFSNSKYYYAK